MEPPGWPISAMPAVANASDVRHACVRAYDPEAASVGGDGCESTTVVPDLRRSGSQLVDASSTMQASDTQRPH